MNSASRGLPSSRRTTKNCWPRPPRPCTYGSSKLRHPTWPPSRRSCRLVGCMPAGGGLVPHIKDSLYLDLVAENLVGSTGRRPPRSDARDVPGSWDEIAPGHLVIAKESQECGWWEATVVERNGDLVTLRYRRLPPLPRHCAASLRRRVDQPRRKVTRPVFGQTQPPITGASPEHASLTARRARRFAPVVPLTPQSENDMDPRTRRGQPANTTRRARPGRGPGKRRTSHQDDPTSTTPTQQSRKSDTAVEAMAHRLSRSNT